MTTRLPDDVWIFAICLLLAYEIFALVTNRTTLSRAVWSASRSQWGPLIPFLVGAICAHFFWCGY